jgi:hypothetical protein
MTATANEPMSAYRSFDTCVELILETGPFIDPSGDGRLDGGERLEAARPYGAEGGRQ